MNIKLISLSIGLALASANAYAGLVIEDGAPRQNTIQVQGASSASQPSASQTETGFEWRRPGAAPTQSATINSHVDTRTAVTQSGRRPRSIESAGWAKDLPLALALRQVVPAEFALKENGVSLNRNVSWGGDRPWDEVLGSLANTGDFVAHIDWSTKEVSLAPRLGEAVRPVAQSSAPVSSVARRNSSSFTVSERAPQATFVAAQRPIAPPAPQWSLDPSLTLRENIEQWGKKAGWTIIWEGADYPIAAKANFTGDFSSPEGPVAKLIEAYESSDQPLLAKLTTMDRVLYIRNKFHENTQVMQTSPTAIGNQQ